MINKLGKFVKGRVFIAIDAANIEKSAQDLPVDPKDANRRTIKNLGWRVDYRKLANYFKRNCKLKKLSFYSASFGTKNHNDFLLFLKSAGYEIKTKPVKEIKDRQGNLIHRKANFDVEISVDSLDSIGDFDTFILFSGDSDFAYLLDYLNNKGKETIVISTRWHIAKELIGSADLYIDIYKLRRKILRISKMPKTRP